jgi:dihydroflavonol-4-reductase
MERRRFDSSTDAVRESQAHRAVGSTFVTGGTGLIGSYLIPLLVPTEGVLYVGARGKVGRSDLPRVAKTPLDITWSDLRIPEGVETVIHLAGEKSDCARMWAVNHEGTRKLVEAAGRAGVRRFVYLSSVGVYGVRKHAGMVDRNHPRTPRNTYEASKNAGEECVRELCPRLGIEHVIVQPTNVIGHVPGRSYPLIGLMRIIRSGRFIWFGRLDPWVNYVAVEDVAALLLAASSRGRDGGTYIVNTPARLREVVEWVSSELELPAPILRLPAWIGALAGAAGGAMERVACRAMAFNAQRYLELTNTTIYDGASATAALGFTYPVGIEQTIRNLVRAYRAEGRL